MRSGIAFALIWLFVFLLFSFSIYEVHSQPSPPPRNDRIQLQSSQFQLEQLPSTMNQMMGEWKIADTKTLIKNCLYCRFSPDLRVQPNYFPPGNWKELTSYCKWIMLCTYLVSLGEEVVSIQFNCSVGVLQSLFTFVLRRTFKFPEFFCPAGNIWALFNSLCFSSQPQNWLGFYHFLSKLNISSMNRKYDSSISPPSPTERAISLVNH